MKGIRPGKPRPMPDGETELYEYLEALIKPSRTHEKGSSMNSETKNVKSRQPPGKPRYGPGNPYYDHIQRFDHPQIHDKPGNYPARGYAPRLPPFKNGLCRNPPAR
jgi:hypothetical protein